MNFKPELVAKILAGEKTQTRRMLSDNPRSPWFKEHCGIKVERAYAVCPGRGKSQVAKVAVHTVWAHAVGKIYENEARAEGFASKAEFIAYWEQLHGHFDPHVRVWAIRFSLIDPDDYALWE